MSHRQRLRGGQATTAKENSSGNAATKICALKKTTSAPASTPEAIQTRRPSLAPRAISMSAVQQPGIRYQEASHESCQSCSLTPNSPSQSIAGQPDEK